jgi:hypothetical protein
LYTRYTSSVNKIKGKQRETIKRMILRARTRLMARNHLITLGEET